MPPMRLIDARMQRLLDLRKHPKNRSCALPAFLLPDLNDLEDGSQGIISQSKQAAASGHRDFSQLKPRRGEMRVWHERPVQPPGNSSWRTKTVCAMGCRA